MWSFSRMMTEIHEKEIMEWLNPPISLERYEDSSLPNMRFNLINDSICVGGTKQRFLFFLIKNISQKNLVYAGPEGGLAHVAISMISYLYNKNVIIFLNGNWRPDSQNHPLVSLSIRFGANIIRDYNNEEYTCLRKAQYCAEEYVKNHPSCYLFPFGLMSSPTELPFQYFRSSLLIALPNIFQYYIPIRLWLAVGSGFLLTVLHSLWPSTTFMIVQVGKKISQNILNTITSYELFIAPESFGEYAIYQPSYETIPWYDAKIWRFILLYGQDGDFIWNVGAIPNESNIKYQNFIEKIKLWRIRNIENDVTNLPNKE